MKKITMRLLLLVSVFLTGSIMKVGAIDVSPYSETFTGLSTSKHDFAPVGWGHIVDYLPYSGGGWGGDDVYVSYSVPTSGGQSGAYLKGGSQSLTNDDYDSKTAYDLLVTPAVKGTVTFYVKNSSYSTGKLSLYQCTKNGDTYTKGEEMTLPDGLSLTSSWQQVTLSLNDYTYIGFRLHNVSLDEFSAEQADIPEKRALEVVTTSLVTPIPVYADANGKAMITAKFTVKNTGNVALHAGEENYSFSLTNSSGEAFFTQNATFDLAVEETSNEIEISGEYTLKDPTVDEWFGLKVEENLTGSSKLVQWFDVKAYVANLDVRLSTGGSINAPIDFEVFKGTRSVDIALKNVGGAPLTLRNINLPDGFTLTTVKTFPYTIGAQETVDEKITLAGAGFKGGDITFDFDGIGTKTIKVKGAVVADNVWWEDFENGISQVWLLPDGSNWRSANLPSSTTYNKKCAENGNVDLSALISPKLTITSGDSLVFFAARRSNSSILKVSYSSDRVNWTLLKEITTDNADEAYRFPTSSSEFKAFVIKDIPVGDYYLSFDAGYAYMDNVYGYELAPVGHDFFIKSFDTDKTGMVNNLVNLKLTVSNLSSEIEAAGTYTVYLYEDGREVSAITGVELASYADHEFSMSYVPHKEGVHKLSAEIKVNDSEYAVKTGEVEVVINKEVALDETIVGSVDKTNSTVPLTLNYKNSISEIVYTSTVLGLEANSPINKLAFPYYSTSAELPAHVTIWLENTEDEAPATALRDTMMMTKVFNSDYTFVPGGSSSNFVLMEFTLPAAFNYTGKNLRLVIQSVSDTYKSYTFGYDSTIDGTILTKKSDVYSSYLSSTMSSVNTVPVVHIYTSKAVPTVSGKVVEKVSKTGLANVNVTLTSGDVIYTDVTDADGAYSIEVFQGNKDYKLTASEKGFADLESDIHVGTTNVIYDVEMDFTAIENARVVGKGTISEGLANEKILALIGEWNADDLARLATALRSSNIVAGIYMETITVPDNVSATIFDNINSNCLIYVTEDAVVPNTWKNVVKGNKANNIVLFGDGAFVPVKSFTAEKISYGRESSDETLETICLPFAVQSIPQNSIVKEFTGYNSQSLSLADVTTMGANMPYIILKPEGTAVNFEATNVVITTDQPVAVEKSGYTFEGTYSPLTNDESTRYYIFDGTAFTPNVEAVSAFRTYFKGIPESVTSLYYVENDASTLSLHVTSVTGDNLKGIPVNLSNSEYGLVYPTAYLSEEGECTIRGVRGGVNVLSIDASSLSLAKYVDNNLVITKDRTLDIVLQEAVRAPYALKAEKLHDAHTGQTDVVLNWNNETDYFFDDFESYDAFSINFQPWTGIDGDKEATAQIQGSYPNSMLPQYATIFNPLTITPPLWYSYPVFLPYSGKQYAAFIRTASGAVNNDWLISPKIKVGVDNVVRFMAKAADRYNEQFKVGVSTTGTEMSDFEFLTPGNYETVNYQAWKTIEYSLAKYEGKEVYIAIQYVSKAYFMLMVDDFYVGPSSIKPSKAARVSRSNDNPSEKFKVYCDGTFIAETEDTSYRFENLSVGTHLLSVKAVYRVSESDMSEAISVDIEDASHYATVKMNVTTNNKLSADGLTVNYINISTGKQTSDVIANGVSQLKSLEKGSYLVNISADYYESYNENLTLDGDKELNVILKEQIITPYNITADFTPAAAEDKSDVLLKWNQDLGFTDSFEDYQDFSQTFGEWTTIDLDGLPPYGVRMGGTDITFPGCDKPSPCMIFNPKTTTPSMEEDGAMLAPDGDKYVAFFSAQLGQSNDWLISPVQKIREGYVLRFIAKSYEAAYKERVAIAISTKKDTETFEILDELELPADWMQYEVDLSKYEGEEVYIAFHYISYDKFIMQLDLFYVGPGESDEETPTLGNATYNIYLNGVLQGTTTDTNYTFNNLDNGKSYTAGVKAVYVSGESGLAEYTFVCGGSTSVDKTSDSDVIIYGGEGIIHVKTLLESYTIKVYDSTGRLISLKRVEDSDTDIAVEKGVYVVEVLRGNDSVRGKVLVK